MQASRSSGDIKMRPLLWSISSPTALPSTMRFCQLADMGHAATRSRNVSHSTSGKSSKQSS